MIVKCPDCGHEGTLRDDAVLSQRVRCSQCQNTFRPQDVSPQRGESPASAIASDAPIGQFIFCTRCGQKNDGNHFRCTRCGNELHGSSSPAAVVGDGTMGGLIPYKNSQALMAYYFGIFSLVPCFGLPLGIIALVLGIKGLRYADLHPQAKGKAHAWVGIILGGGLSLLYLIGAIAFVVVTVIASNR